MPLAGPERSDEDLVAAMGARGDRTAFAELFRRHEASAYGLALRITHDHETAADVIQEAMLRIWKAAPRYRQEGTVRNWILKTTARESLMTLRKQRRKQAHEKRAGAVSRPVPASPEQQAERSELQAQLRGVIDRLPEVEQQLLALYYAGDLSQREISKQMDMPQTTVSMRMQNALNSLRASLAGLSATAIVLDRDLLAPALCGNQSAGIGVEALLTRLSGRLKAGRRASVWTRAVAGAAGLGMLAALGLWLYPSAPEARAALPASAPEQPAKPAKFQYTWSLDKLPEGFQILYGTPEFKTGTEAGLHARPRKRVVVAFPKLDWPHAFRVKAYLSSETVAGPATTTGIEWLQDGRTLGHRKFLSGANYYRRKVDTKAGGPPLELLYLGPDMCMNLGGEAWTISEFSGRGNGILGCYVDGMTLHRLVIEALTPEETETLAKRIAHIKLAGPHSIVGPAMLYQDSGFELPVAKP